MCIYFHYLWRSWKNLGGFLKYYFGEVAYFNNESMIEYHFPTKPSAWPAYELHDQGFSLSASFTFLTIVKGKDITM